MAKKLASKNGGDGSAVMPADTTGSETVQRAIPKKPAGMAPLPGAAQDRATALTQEAVALRAYFIHLSGTGAGETENWLRAERELKAELGLL